jgi:predicted AAA+ superfamily ATPase
VLQRVETVWRPASAEESFEIVRRRLFQPMPVDNYKARDLVLARFGEEYRKNAGEYPAEASKPDYEKRMRAAYPIHPELFDRLYKDWGTLDKLKRAAEQRKKRRKPRTDQLGQSWREYPL